MKDKAHTSSVKDFVDKVSQDEFEILTIDQNLLDKEWLNQPRFFFRYASMLADARQKYEEAKANLKVVSAEKDYQTRRIAAKKEEKITEAMVQARIQSNPFYQQAEQAVFTAKHNMDVLDAAVEALRHRKDALENLVRLHGMNYFSDPRADGDNRRVVDDLKMRQTVKDRRTK